MNVSDRIVSQVGRHVDAASPMVDARLLDGSRVNAIIPPLSLIGPVLTIRKFGKTPITAQQLLQFGSLTPKMLQFLDACVKGKLNIVVAGGTGVSPVRGVIEALSNTADAKDKHVIVGFKSPDDMLFRDDLKNWDDKLDLWLTVDGAPEGYEGKIGLVTVYIPEIPLHDVANAKAVVVGPPPMMKFSVAGLLEKGFKEENIWVSQERKMCCGLGKCGHCRVGEKYICLDGPVFNYTECKNMID